MTSTHLTTATFTIRGTRPLLFHAFGPDVIPADGQKEKSGVAGNDPNEWQKTMLMIEPTRELYLKLTYVFGCLCDSAQHTPRK